MTNSFLILGNTFEKLGLSIDYKLKFYDYQYVLFVFDGNKVAGSDDPIQMLITALFRYANHQTVRRIIRRYEKRSDRNQSRYVFLCTNDRSYLSWDRKYVENKKMLMRN